MNKHMSALPPATPSFAEVSALKARVAELESQLAQGGEPVAWRYKNGALEHKQLDTFHTSFDGKEWLKGEPLYTRPAPEKSCNDNAEVLRVAQELNRYFTSGNSVQVEHARIPKG